MDAAEHRATHSVGSPDSEDKMGHSATARAPHEDSTPDGGVRTNISNMRHQIHNEGTPHDPTTSLIESDFATAPTEERKKDIREAFLAQKLDGESPSDAWRPRRPTRRNGMWLDCKAANDGLVDEEDNRAKESWLRSSMALFLPKGSLFSSADGGERKAQNKWVKEMRAKIIEDHRSGMIGAQEKRRQERWLQGVAAQIVAHRRGYDFLEG
ncbi:hypothetical protein BS17DRAFT_276363 [Gyrodon lividus]|nr:hypothetical protein BS17DRAFT_276363 [Gyrodon lividus]